jgi:BMFP domain-containing protein YqiC
MNEFEKAMEVVLSEALARLELVSDEEIERLYIS